MIKSLEIRNFKSLKNVKLDLSALNVFLGPNAAGKSNVVKALEFLRDIIDLNDVEEAYERHGGPEEAGSKSNGAVRRIEFVVDVDFSRRKPRRPTFETGDTVWQLTSAKYAVAFTSYRKRDQRVEKEMLCVKARRRTPRENAWSNEIEHLILTRSQEGLQLRPLGDQAIGKRLSRHLHGLLTTKKAALAVGSEIPVHEIIAFKSYLGSLKFYKINVEAARNMTSPSGSAELAGDGANLARMLFVLKQGKAPFGLPLGRGLKEGFLGFMKTSVPGYRDFKVKKVRGLAKESVTFEVREESGRSFPPDSLSDGTIRIMCYFLALMHHYPPASVICFEEPETSVHPYVLDSMVEIAKDHPDGSQVILTTHSKTVADRCEPSEVFLVSKEGAFSEIQRADSDEEILHFCKHYGIGEAWERGVVGAVP